MVTLSAALDARLHASSRACSPVLGGKRLQIAPRAPKAARRALQPLRGGRVSLCSVDASVARPLRPSRRARMRRRAGAARALRDHAPSTQPRFQKLTASPVEPVHAAALRQPRATRGARSSRCGARAPAAVARPAHARSAAAAWDNGAEVGPALLCAPPRSAAGGARVRGRRRTCYSAATAGRRRVRSAVEYLCGRPLPVLPSGSGNEVESTELLFPPVT